MGSKIKCSHALVKKLSEAQEILDLVNKGEKFGALCKKRSIDSGSAKRDGNLGCFATALQKFCIRMIWKPLQIKNEPVLRVKSQAKAVAAMRKLLASLQ